MPTGVKRFFGVDLNNCGHTGISGVCHRDELAISRSRTSGKDSAPDAAGTSEIQLTRKPPTDIL
jgi:hypothetical protein